MELERWHEAEMHRRGRTVTNSESVQAEVVGTQEEHPATLLADLTTWSMLQPVELAEEAVEAEMISAAAPMETISAE